MLNELSLLTTDDTLYIQAKSNQVINPSYGKNIEEQVSYGIQIVIETERQKIGFIVQCILVFLVI